MPPLLIRLLRKLPIPMWPDLAIKQARAGQTVIPLRGWCQLDGHSCGYTAAFSILEYFKPDSSPFTELRRHCDPDPEEGCGPHEIVKGLRAYGLKCRVTRALTKRAVDLEIGKGNPVIIGVEGALLGCRRGPAVQQHLPRQILAMGQLELV